VGYSLEAQRRDLPAFAKSQDWHFNKSDIFDEGIASTSKQNVRYIFQNAIEKVGTGYYDNGWMIVREIDRSLRSVNLGLWLLSILREHNIGIATPDERVNPLHLGDLILSIVKFYGAEDEKKKRKKEQLRSFKIARDSGIYLSAAPNPPDGFLWDRNQKKLVKDPIRAPIVKYILNQYHLTNYRLFLHLVEKKILSKTGKRYLIGSLIRLRQRLIYSGKMFNSQKVIIQAKNIQPIIPYNIYLKNLKASKQKKIYVYHNNSKPKYENLFMSILFCGFCHHKIYLNISPKGIYHYKNSSFERKHDYLGIFCRGRKNKICSEFKGISYDIIETNILADLKSNYFDITKLEKAYNKYSNSERINDNLSVLYQQLSGFKEKQSNLISAIENGINLNSIKDRLIKLSELINRMEVDIIVEKERLDSPLISFDVIKNRIQQFDDYEFQKKFNLVHCLIKHIDYFNDYILIYYIFEKSPIKIDIK